jgi:hypothetical protein
MIQTDGGGVTKLHHPDDGEASTEGGPYSNRHHSPESESSIGSDPFSDSHAIPEEHDDKVSSSNDEGTTPDEQGSGQITGYKTRESHDRGNKDESNDKQQLAVNQATDSPASASIDGAVATSFPSLIPKHRRSKSLKENLLSSFRTSWKRKETRKEMEEVPAFVGKNKAERILGEELPGYNPPKRKYMMPSLFWFALCAYYR